MCLHRKDVVLITGGHGFIGSHLARKLFSTGKYLIRIVDTVTNSLLDEKICDEFVNGNLCDPIVCQIALQGVAIVFHFAATMGGMGAIHSDNDFIIYKENHMMTTNLLEASVKAGIKSFFYASSACVYPAKLQCGDISEVSLHESDVWQHSPPTPQGLYGLEKLASEILVSQFTSKMDIRIARFHNVYGPGGTWRGGREKAPAAMLRKAIAAKFCQESTAQFEIWGDGSQRRSFLFIEDAILGILKLMESSYCSPVNIGSEEAVSIQELAEIALGYAGNPAVEFCYDRAKPLGVVSRNSNNDLAKQQINWKPATSLEAGMYLTGAWVEEEARKLISSRNTNAILQNLLHSDVVHFESERITFAILLPITSRGGSSPEECLSNLAYFIESFKETTWRDTHTLGGKSYKAIIYLALDHDDAFLLAGTSNINKAEQFIRAQGILDVKSLICSYPRGSVCYLWRDCAKRAWEDRCDYMVLMGDDVKLQDEGWMRLAHAQFAKLASEQGVPFGFGCVAFTDVSFPGMPTFPIIHRTHLDIFNGNVIPKVFVNQDGDPFLFQLYRRWNCSRMFPSRITNRVGGGNEARYIKQSAKDWTFQVLSDAVACAENWVKACRPELQMKVTLDIAIPCYRVDLDILEVIFALEVPSTLSVMFIIIVDNPMSPHTLHLQHRYGHRADVRIRVNEENLGASESRNRAMQESSADWIHFLDDDVVPEYSLLYETEKIICAHPKAAGFVGTSVFPRADTVFTTAIHLAGVTYFWDIAKKIPDDVPWGVTANLIVRRNIKDEVKFDPRYPKTGGGEDIDFCRRKRDYFIQNEHEGFYAAPKVTVTHPWWNKGKRSYWRFYMWSVGDGALISQHPELSYRDAMSNSAEMMLLCALGAMGAIQVAKWSALAYITKSFIMVVLANVIHDIYRHLWRNPERNHGINSGISRAWWLLAVVESSFIRMFSEIGRLRGIIGRGEYLLIGKRFDWFAGRSGLGPVEEEMMNSRQRVMLAIFLMGISTI